MSELVDLVNAMTQGLAVHEVIYDQTGTANDYRFLSVNPAYEKLTGLHGEDIIGRTVREVLPGVEQYWIDTFCSVAASGKALEYENYVAPLGKWFSSLVYRPQPGRFAVIITDISERKRIEAEREQLLKELEAKNAELERFVYTVSHDLKSPLITIKGFAGIIAQDLAENNTSSISDDIGRICAAADMMDTLLSDLLELSRVGRVVNPPELIELSHIVKDALLMLNGSLAGRGVQVDVDAELPTVYADRTRLTEVVQNLLENAIKFMGEQPHPRIEIGARQEAEHVLIYIRDNGSGIAPGYLEQVFTLFEQLDPQIEGSGLGLAFVKRIIEIHGGSIWAESDGEGSGSTFYFSLPHPPKEHE